MLGVDAEPPSESSDPRSVHTMGCGLVSGLNWNTDDPDILTEMDFDGLMAWVDNYCKANPLAKVTTGAVMLVQELRARAQRK